MKISFYYVDEKYIQYLKEIEIKERGYTTVPNMTYHHTNKFVYGVVLSINEVNYYVPFSHYTRKQEDNILVQIKDHKKYKPVGSLRFNYMIPVPKKCLQLVDFNDFDEKKRILLRKEYKSCLSMLSRIQKKAQKTYERVISQKDESLINNSCMFERLEAAYMEYTSKNSKNKIC